MAKTKGSNHMTEQQYHRMIEEVEDYAIILLDKDGNILNWNKGAERIKGYNSTEIVGKNFRSFYLPEDAASKLPERLINEAEVNGRAMHEGWRVRKDGTRFWGSIVITAIHDDDNNTIGFTKVTRDLTERKITEDQIKQYTANLEFKSRELEQFASIASHDLQEPLRKIQIFSGLLRDNLDKPETATRYLEKISSSAERMSSLIREILRYSKLSIEEMFEPVNLNDTLKVIKEDFEVLINERNALITYPEMPVVMGIPIQLQQLFSNLIGNSLKFSTGDRAIVTISVEPVRGADLNIGQLLEDRDYYRFTIEDNGIGFSQEYMEKIFLMFQRLDASQQGTGIGLALCKKIIENHHGYITAKSEVDKGTSIIFYLPRI